MKPGDQVRLQIPMSWPSWMSNAYQEPWRRVLFKLHNQIITIKEVISQSVQWKGMEHPHYFAEIVEDPDYLICLEWIQPVTNKVPCNCSITKILAHGCQEPNHI